MKNVQKVRFILRRWSSFSRSFIYQELGEFTGTRKEISAHQDHLRSLYVTDSITEEIDIEEVK